MRILFLVGGTAIISFASGCGGKSQNDVGAITAGGAAAFGNASGGASAYGLGGTWSTGGIGGTTVNTLPDWDANCARTIPLPVTPNNLATCTFDVPPTVDTIDSNHANVVFVSGAGERTYLTSTPDLTGATCDTSASWYFDSRLLPKKILLCPTACDAVKANVNSALELELGCPAVPLFI